MDIDAFRTEQMVKALGKFTTHRGGRREKGLWHIMDSFRLRPDTVASKLGVSIRTFHYWHQNPGKIPAYAAHEMAIMFNLGGLTFDNLTTPLDCRFETLWHSLVDASEEKKLSGTHLASKLGYKAPAMAYRMLRMSDYAKKNLTLLQLMRWARAVGFGNTTCHRTDLPYAATVAGFNAEHDSDGGVLMPEHGKTLGTPTYDEHTSEAGVPLEQATRRFPGDGRRQTVYGAKPVEAGLHLPLYVLLQVIRKEMTNQMLSPDDLVHIADPEITSTWLAGRVLHTGVFARYDMTVGHLDALARELGFGGLVMPALGDDLQEGLTAILENIPFAAFNRTNNVGRLLGSSYNYSVLKKMSVLDLPVVLLEHLSVWAWADGLAFRSAKGGSGHEYKGWSKEQAGKSVAVARLALQNKVTMGPVGLRALVARLGYNANTSAVGVHDYKRFNPSEHSVVVY